MRYGVFCIRPVSHYEYDPVERYHLHKSHLAAVRSLRGRWIIYYEPKSMRASRGYFAIALVDDIIDDPRDRDLHFALIVPGSYLDFADPFPFSQGGNPIEASVRRLGGGISGVVRKAVRPVIDTDFSRIVEMGLGVPFEDFIRPAAAPMEADTSQAAYDLREQERVVLIGSRAIRDRVFRQSVLRAYDYRCAILGLRLGDGQSLHEAQGAHIRAVHDRGPDIVSNGIALSGTARWLFDNKMISLNDDYRIMVSPRLRGAEQVRPLFPKDGRMILPRRTVDYPNPQFLSWHRSVTSSDRDRIS